MDYIIGNTYKNGFMISYGLKNQKEMLYPQSNGPHTRNKIKKVGMVLDCFVDNDVNIMAKIK